MIIPTADLYTLLSELPRSDHTTQRIALPPNGIYVFYEHGETIPWHDTSLDRIVRVGTHVADNRYPTRIRQHYGSRKSFRGNKNASIFRRRVAGALLRRVDPNDPRLVEWEKTKGYAYSEVEEQVSHRLRDTFTFSSIRVDTAAERLELESALIALLAQHPLGSPSADWLGKFATSPIIVRTGLWNNQRVDAAPLTTVQFTRLEELVRATLEEVR